MGRKRFTKLEALFYNHLRAKYRKKVFNLAWFGVRCDFYGGALQFFQIPGTDYFRFRVWVVDGKCNFEYDVYCGGLPDQQLEKLITTWKKLSVYVLTAREKEMSSFFGRS